MPPRPHVLRFCGCSLHVWVDWMRMNYPSKQDVTSTIEQHEQARDMLLLQLPSRFDAGRFLCPKNLKLQEFYEIFLSFSTVKSLHTSVNPGKKESVATYINFFLEDKNIFLPRLSLSWLLRPHPALAAIARSGGWRAPSSPLRWKDRK